MANPVLARLVLAVLLLLQGMNLAAQAAESAKLKRDGPLAGRVAPALIAALNALNDGRVTGASATARLQSALPELAHPLPGILKDDAVQAPRLAIELDVLKVDAAALKAISATGAQVFHSSARWNAVSLLASIEEIDALTRIPGVRLIKLSYAPRTRQSGVADNQGGGSMKADLVRQTTGLSGAGQKVGVISDSCNRTSIGPGVVTGVVPNAILSGLSNQATGDIPAQIQVIDFSVDAGGTDEGSAMMELIHDIAPNASIAFASGTGGITVFADNLAKLRAAGCTVTCDDLGYFDEPFFQDSLMFRSTRATPWMKESIRQPATIFTIGAWVEQLLVFCRWTSPPADTSMSPSSGTSPSKVSIWEPGLRSTWMCCFTTLQAPAQTSSPEAALLKAQPEAPWAIPRRFSIMPIPTQARSSACMWRSTTLLARGQTHSSA
jgi:hypothetical protein